jgi:hypothetical protein
MNITVFWDMTSCSLVEVHQPFPSLLITGSLNGLLFGFEDACTRSKAIPVTGREGP